MPHEHSPQIEAIVRPAPGRVAWVNQGVPESARRALASLCEACGNGSEL